MDLESEINFKQFNAINIFKISEKTFFVRKIFMKNQQNYIYLRIIHNPPPKRKTFYKKKRNNEVLIIAHQRDSRRGK